MENSIHWAVQYELTTFRIAYIILLASTITYLIYWIFNSTGFRITGKVLYVIGTSGVTLSIIFRLIHSGRLPLISSYEIFLLLGWMMLLIALFADRIIKNVFATTFTSFFVAAAMLYIEGHFESVAGDVVPALQSNWLEFHVITTMLGYAAFSVSVLAAEAYLINKLEWMEELSYKLAAFGFPFLTIGIASGSVWAQEAWGTWWGWDPKETASLIMWLVYAAYLHMRLVRGWRGSKAAWMNILGFISMLFCFMGLNWISQYFNLASEHTYASGSSKMAYFIYMILAIAVMVFVGSLIIRASKNKQIAKGKDN